MTFPFRNTSAFASLVKQEYELISRLPTIIALLRESPGPRVLPARWIRHWQQDEDDDASPSQMLRQEIFLAAYLRILWRSLYPVTSCPAQFVDVGCGAGLLVRILLALGYKGFGFDRKRHDAWPTELANKELRVSNMTPLDIFETISFEPGTCFIGNHADELTPWIPLLAGKTRDSMFISIPCCRYGLEQSRDASKWTWMPKSPPIDLSALPRCDPELSAEALPASKRYQQYLFDISTFAGMQAVQDPLVMPANGNVGQIGTRRDSAEVLDVTTTSQYLRRILDVP